jgi:hypothetical protein
MMGVIFFESPGNTRATTLRRIPTDRPSHQMNSYENLNSREFSVNVRKEMVL